MKIDIKILQKIIRESFHEVYQDKDKIKYNSKRSSRFVTVLSEKIKEKWFKNYSMHLQSTNENGKSIPGEWLFDMCITETKWIEDKRYKDSKAQINTRILFALESEFSTSIKDFADDFGKMICSSAETYLYIQGLNQIIPSERASFIERRLNIIKEQLNDHLKDFFIAFVPTPGKVPLLKSLWELNEDLSDWVEVYGYDKGRNKFIEVFNL